MCQRFGSPFLSSHYPNQCRLLVRGTLDKSISEIQIKIIIMMTSSNGNIFRRYWPFVRGIYRSPVNSPHKGQWRGALMFSLICVWINGWVNNGDAGDLICYRAHYDVTVMDDDSHDNDNNKSIWKQLSIIFVRPLICCKCAWSYLFYGILFSV